MQIPFYVDVLKPLCINLCSNKSEFAFFVRWLQSAHFLILEVKMKNKIISILLIIAILTFMLVSCDTSTNYEPNDNNETSNSDNSTNDNNKDDNDVNKGEKPSQTVYAEDTVVNRFITEFNDKSGYDFSDIRKGNIRTKYYAYANECYVEILNANDAYAKCFNVSINGGKETSNRDKMFAVFKQVVKTLDKSITDAQINSVIEYLESQQYMVSDYKISNSVTVETYVPIVELSYGKSDCRIDVISSNYK